MKTLVQALAIFGGIALALMLRRWWMLRAGAALPAVIVDEDQVLRENDVDTRRGRLLRAAIRYRTAVELASGRTPWTGWMDARDAARSVAAAAAIETDDQLFMRRGFASIPRSVISELTESDRELAVELADAQLALRALMHGTVGPGSSGRGITPIPLSPGPVSVGRFAPPPLRLAS